MVDANTAVRPEPALLPALGAMTWLQALVALALFAPCVIAPRAHVEVWRLSMFSCAVFAVGIPASFWGGGFIARMGSGLTGVSISRCLLAGDVDQCGMPVPIDHGSDDPEEDDSNEELEQLPWERVELSGSWWSVLYGYTDEEWTPFFPDAPPRLDPPKRRRAPHALSL